MILKWIFDRVVSLLRLLILWPVLLVVAILIKVEDAGMAGFVCAETCGEGREAVRLPLVSDYEGE